MKKFYKSLTPRLGALILSLLCSGVAAANSTSFFIAAQGDYRARWAQGSLRDYVIKKARMEAYKFAYKRCHFSGTSGNLNMQDDEVIATGIEQRHMWATVDVSYLCLSPSSEHRTAVGSGVGKSIISAPNAQSLAKARAYSQAKDKCSDLEFHGALGIHKILDSHYSCSGHNCTAWFSAVYICRL
jgi:hypothetical protein